MKCNYCQNLFSERRGKDHEEICKLNPLRISRPKGPKKGTVPWNRGLTKHTDKRVKNNSLQIKTGMSRLKAAGYVNPVHTQEYWTDERRKAKSNWRKKLHIENPEYHPNRRLAGNRTKMTYPERVAFDWLMNNSVKFEHQAKIQNFFVDFLCNKIIIEIDGEHFHPIGNEFDARRDIILNNLGYNVIRIRAKELIEDKLVQIFNLK